MPIFQYTNICHGTTQNSVCTCNDISCKELAKFIRSQLSNVQAILEVGDFEMALASNSYL